MAKTAVLSLGTRKDAPYWSDACAAEIGYGSRLKLATPTPALADIRSFFAGGEEWLFLGGHFTTSDHLYNADGSVRIAFRSDRVIIDHPDAKGVELKKGDGFKQHMKAKALFWGGCDVHSDPAVVADLRSLFGNPLMVGWRGTTGWEALYSVMGGFGAAPPHSARNFFDRVKANPSDAATVRTAWLDTAKDTTWGAAVPSFEARFSVIMPDGAEHRLPPRENLDA